MEQDSTITMDQKELENTFNPIHEIVDNKQFDVAMTECNKIMESHAQAQPRTKEYFYTIFSKATIASIHFFKAKHELEIAASTFEASADLCKQETNLYLSTPYFGDMPIKIIGFIYKLGVGNCYEMLEDYGKAQFLYKQFLISCEEEQRELLQLPSLPGYYKEVESIIKDASTRLNRCKAEIKNQSEKQK